jgi:hypothetical protein
MMIMKSSWKVRMRLKMTEQARWASVESYPTKDENIYVRALFGRKAVNISHHQLTL